MFALVLQLPPFPDSDLGVGFLSGHSSAFPTSVLAISFFAGTVRHFRPSSKTRVELCVLYVRTHFIAVGKLCNQLLLMEKLPPGRGR